MSHVTLRSRLQFEEGDSMVRFDEGAGLLVLIRHRELVALAMPPDDDQAPQRPPIRCESAGRVERISFSLDHQLAAVQRSAVDLDIFDLASGSTFPLAARSSGSSGLAARHRGRILGSHWPGSEACELAVVTTAGVELYRVLRERRSLKLLRRVSQPVSWSVYSHETRLMLLAAGQQDNLLSGLQLQPRSAVRLPRFEARHVSVHRVYDALYCAHIDEEARKVVLYALYRDAVLRQHELPTHSARAALSVCDNLLVVHALDQQARLLAPSAAVATLFDLRINRSCPISAPLPLTTLPADGFSPVYSPHWLIAPPDKVVDPLAGRAGRLRLNLRAIAASSIDKVCLLEFLLLRSNLVLLEVLADALSELEPLPTLSRMRRHLLAAMTAYLHSQVAAGASADPVLGEMLLRLLAAEGSHAQLQLLLTQRAAPARRILPDSVPLALFLFQLAPAFAPAADFGLDVLKRLGAPAQEALVAELLQQQDVLAACRVIRSLRLLAFPPRPVLAAAAECGSEVFTAVYSFFLLRNASCRGSASFAPEEACDEFVARFEALQCGARTGHGGGAT
ncbi:hypothetical protein EMIHUDRAFT_451592 [Emiliania huxleyi CCMP1516]|uniref:Mic1 domain-containing protein n=2 Tax=Emiliania huxleyi TaxID=2903 RepID=A0A0D3IXK0_EMIH1|nr:hypothetical protein EMIHUDRAFT_451592 [Emiliania huxleyi CCMP1516]EOD15985.1 hypothetical protein EMIHUDRAFT_451592 [Emiliania huxleyi CCMP1516]|eukprot:XP_005768414.1 hypothetical protein EMIHUDRAFT_451592 [Emiliania huxleyi CCMP1516]